VALSPDGSSALIGGSWTDENIELLELELNRKRQVFKGHTGGVTSVAFSPDGKRILSTAMDGTLRLWDVATGRQLRRIKAWDGPLYAARFSPDGLHAVSVDGEPFDYDGIYAPFNPGSTVRYWDLATGSQLARWQAPTPQVYSIGYTQDGGHVLASGSGAEVATWPIPQGPAARAEDLEKPIAQDPPSAQLYCFDSLAPTFVRFLGNDRLVAGTEDNTLRRWNARTGEYLGAKKPAALQQWPATVAVSGDGRYAVSGEFGHTGKEVWQWQLSDGLETLHVAGNDENSALAVTEDGSYVAIAALVRDGGKLAWDVSIYGRAQKAEVAGNSTGSYAPERVQFAPDGSVLAMLGCNREPYRYELRLWDLRGGGEKTLPLKTTGPAAGLCFSGDGRVLLCASAREVFLVDTGEAKLLGHWSVPEHIGSLALSPDGRRFLTGGSDSNVRLRKMGQGEPLAVFEEHRSAVRDVAFSPDGKLAASAGQDRSVRVWRLPE
jgi:WD40 repeat protein